METQLKPLGLNDLICCTFVKEFRSEADFIREGDNFTGRISQIDEGKITLKYGDGGFNKEYPFTQEIPLDYVEIEILEKWPEIKEACKEYLRILGLIEEMETMMVQLKGEQNQQADLLLRVASDLNKSNFVVDGKVVGVDFGDGWSTHEAPKFISVIDVEVL